MIIGGVASRFTVTTVDAVPPSLVAVQVSVVPLVSVVIDVGSQPVVVIDEGDWASVTLHVTETSLVYQPLFSDLPSMCGAISGGVVSAAKIANVPRPSVRAQTAERSVALVTSFHPSAPRRNRCGA